MWEQWGLEWREWETAPADWVGCRRRLWSSSIVSGRSQRCSDCEITQFSPVVPLSRCISVTLLFLLSVRKRNQARCRRTDREQDAQICSAWSPLLPACHGTWHSMTDTFFWVIPSQQSLCEWWGEGDAPGKGSRGQSPSLAPLAPCRRSEAARPAQHNLHNQPAATPSECQVIPRKIDFINLLVYCPLIYHDYSWFSNHAFFVSSRCNFLYISRKIDFINFFVLLPSDISFFFLTQYLFPSSQR